MSCSLCLQSQYNMRATECKVAAQIIARQMGQTALAQSRGEKLTLRDVQRAVGRSLSQMVAQLQLTPEQGGPLKEAPYTEAEISAAMGSDVRAFFANSPVALAVLDHNKEFFLRARAIHVYSEAERVDRFQAVCSEREAKRGDAQADLARLRQLGALMSESHASCRDLYNCSAPALEDLIAVCNRAGALVTITG